MKMFDRNDPATAQAISIADYTRRTAPDWVTDVAAIYDRLSQAMTDHGEDNTDPVLWLLRCDQLNNLVRATDTAARATGVSPTDRVIVDALTAAHDREETRGREHPDLAPAHIRRNVDLPTRTISHHSQPDGTHCLWSGCPTIEPHGWCPNRCQPHTA